MLAFIVTKMSTQAGQIHYVHVESFPLMGHTLYFIRRPNLANLHTPT